MNGCVIVETRIIPNLQEIIQKKHLDYIPKEWGLTMFLSQQNIHLIDEKKLDREVRAYILPNEFDINAYNKLLTSIQFWDRLPYENVLIFQSDSELLTDGVEDFLGFSFIGAPDIRCKGMMNGGLSLRKVKDCHSVCHSFPYTGTDNEDWYFCKHLSILPDFETASFFSVETKFHYNSIGAHAIDRYLTPEQCKLIRNQYK